MKTLSGQRTIIMVAALVADMMDAGISLVVFVGVVAMGMGLMAGKQ